MNRPGGLQRWMALAFALLALAACGRNKFAAGPEEKVRLRLPIASTDVKPVSVGGKADAPSGPGLVLNSSQAILIEPDRALLAHLAPQPDWLQSAVLELPVLRKTGDFSNATLVIHRASENEGTPLMKKPLKEVTAGAVIEIDGFSGLFKSDLEAKSPTASLLVRLEGTTDGTLVLGTPVSPQGRQPGFALTLKHKALAEPLFDETSLIRDGVFTKVQDGHFYYGGKRLRLWGANGHLPREGFDVALNVARLRRMGYNAFRLWGIHDFADAASAKRGEFATPAKGSRAEFDRLDRFIAECHKQGVFLWITAPHYYPFTLGRKGAAGSDTALMEAIRDSLLADGSFLQPGDDWEPWKDAIRKLDFDPHFVKFFDRRLLLLFRRQVEDFLNHLNPYTGKRYAEEEAIAILSFDNENKAPQDILDRGIGGVPAFFQDEIVKQWNGFLNRKYRNEAALQRAYGPLKEGEKWGALGFHPLYGERNGYPAARAADLVEFVCHSVTGFHDALRDTVRGLGKGASTVPLVYNTYYGNNSAYFYTSAQGDVFSTAFYSYTLRSLGDVPPSSCTGESMLYSVKGKPTVIYEMNAGKPNPYRAEFPYRMAALGSWQDWDGAFTHIWGHQGATSEGGDEQWLVQPQRYLDPKAPQGYQNLALETDPVLCSAFAMAGQIFLQNMLHPAPAPATATIGTKAIFSFDNWATPMIPPPAAFAQGMRIELKKEPLGIELSGVQPVEANKAVAAGSEILWDWPRGRLILDSPLAKAYIGRTGDPFRFSGGLSLSGVSTPFVSFSMISADHKALAGPNASRRALISAVSDSQNLGFSMEVPPEAARRLSVHPEKVPPFTKSIGRAPVVQEKVGYTLEFPGTLKGMLMSVDFAFRETSRNKTEAPNRLVVPPQAAWLGLLTFESRQAAALGSQPRPSPVARSQPQRERENPGKENRFVHSSPANEKAPSPAALFNPIPGLKWGMSYDETRKALLSMAEAGNAGEASQTDSSMMEINNSRLLFGKEAQLIFVFKRGRLQKIAATFINSPVWETLVGATNAELGAPLENTKVATGSESSVAKWIVEAPDRNSKLRVNFSQVQGVMEISYEVSP